MKLLIEKIISFHFLIGISRYFREIFVEVRAKAIRRASQLEIRSVDTCHRSADGSS